MSRKTQEAKAEKTEAWKRTLRFRRWTLGSYLCVVVLCLIGSQGPWYQAQVGEKAIGEAVWGTDFRWNTRATEFDAALSRLEGDSVASLTTAEAGLALEDLDAEPPPPGFWERPGFHAHATLWCCLAALFFAGYNLASNATLDLPVLIVSALLAVAVGSAFYALSVAPSTLRRVIEQVTLAGGAGAGAGGVASVDSSTLPGLLTTVSMRFCWGAALMGASAPLLVLNSLLLTFFLKRKP